MLLLLFNYFVRLATTLLLRNPKNSDVTYLQPTYMSDVILRETSKISETSPFNRFTAVIDLATTCTGRDSEVDDLKAKNKRLEYSSSARSGNC